MRLFIIAVFAATIGYTLSVVINSTVSAATLAGFGIEVALGDRAQMVTSEWLGLAGTYLPIYVGLHAIVFLLLNYVLNRPHTTHLSGAMWRALFAVAGAGSLLLLYVGFDAAMGLSGVLVASGRTFVGLSAHVATGALSGLIFAWLCARSPQV